jgi:hypothetical protein
MFEAKGSLEIKSVNTKKITKQITYCKSINYR